MSLRAIIFILLLVAGAARAEDSDCPEAFVERLAVIDRTFEGRDFMAAGVELEALAAEVPDGCPATAIEIRRGLALVGKGRLAAAAELLEVAEGANFSALGRRNLIFGKGYLAYELGDYRRAREEWQEYLSLAQQADDVFGLIEGEVSIAATYAGESVGVGDHSALKDRYQRLLQLAEESQLVRFFPEIPITLGRLLGGASEEGRQLLETGVELARSLDQSAPEAVALGALAVGYLEEDPDQASELLDRALSLAERSYRQHGDPYPLLNLLADRHLVRWRTLPADRAMADSLAALKHVEQVRGGQEQRQARASFLAVWAEAYQRLVGQILSAAGEPPAAADLEAAFQVMESYRARVLADSLDSPVTVDLSQIADALQEDEAMLVFQVAAEEDVFGRPDGGSWLLLISKSGVRLYNLPRRGDLEFAVGQFLKVLARRDGDDGVGSAVLYRSLLAAALGELPRRVDKLILVPDGELHLLPFGSLRAQPKEPPLSLRYQLSTVPSASLWLRWRRATPSPQPAAALILADPRPNGVPGAALRAELGSLPFAAEEGKALLARLGAASELLLGQKASEAELKRRDLSHFGIFHFAAHAVVDTVHPELSAVLLAEGEDQDGNLEARESAELALEDKVVVLSACRSATGTVLRGEGVMSLARSFFSAGASTVVGSLWPLDDWEAKRLFEVFYRHLAAGRSVQRALQQTQRELRRAGAPAAAWAGVVVLGDGTRVPLPATSGGLSPRLLWSLLAVLAVALLGGLRRTRNWRLNGGWRRAGGRDRDV